MLAEIAIKTQACYCLKLTVQTLSDHLFVFYYQ